MNFQETLVVTSPHLKVTNLDFPGGPIVKNLHFQCRGAGPIPGQGNKDPTHPTAQPKKFFNKYMKLNKGHNLLSICYVTSVTLVATLKFYHSPHLRAEKSEIQRGR